MTRTRPLAIWLAVLAGTVMALARPGFARADGAYQSALDRALAAHAAGDFAEARRGMEEAHALEPSARTYRGLAVVAHAEGRYVASVSALVQALASSVRPLTPELRTAVEQLLLRDLREVALLRLSLAPADAEVLVDAEPPVWFASSVLVVAPGPHRLTVRADNRAPYVLDLTSLPGTSETIHIVLAEQAPPPVAANNTPTPALETATPSLVTGEVAHAPARDHKALTWWTPRAQNGVIIAGAAVALASGALWVTAFRRFDDVKTACRALPAAGCTRAQAEELLSDSHVRGYALAAGVTTALAGAALASALGLALWQRRTQVEAGAFFGVSPTSLLVHGRF